MNERALTYKFFHYTKANFGEAVYVVGSIPVLGNWDPQRALRLDWNHNHHWTLDLEFDISKGFEYKFFTSTFDNPSLSSIKWEEGDNFRVLAHETFQHKLSNSESRNDDPVEGELNPEGEIKSQSQSNFANDEYNRDQKIFEKIRNHLRTSRNGGNERNLNSEIKEDDSVKSLISPEITEIDIVFHTAEREMQYFLGDYLNEYSRIELNPSLNEIYASNPTIKKEELIFKIATPLAEKIWNLPEFHQIVEKYSKKFENELWSIDLEVGLQIAVYRSLKYPFGEDVFSSFERLKREKGLLSSR